MLNVHISTDGFSVVYLMRSSLMNLTKKSHAHYNLDFYQFLGHRGYYIVN